MVNLILVATFCGTRVLEKHYLKIYVHLMIPSGLLETKINQNLLNL